MTNWFKRLRSLPPWRRPGDKVLDKYDSSDPASADRKVIAQLLSHGADLSRSRHVVHYFYFPHATTRLRAEERLKAIGYSTRHGVAGDGEQSQSLIAERHGLVNDSAIGRERKMFMEIAADNKGEYDGWEASLDQ